MSASNATLLCTLDGTDLKAVYKPADGEAPLWDFPPRTLHRREVAAWVVDRALGWNMVPPTVLRDGPYGVGSAQLFVEHDPEQHYFWLMRRGGSAVVDQLQRMVVFDLIVNNADRKASHVLLDPDEQVRLVDHGICFHDEPKLRTVAWHFLDDPVPPAMREEAARLGERLAVRGDEHRAELTELLERTEVDALVARAQAVADLETFPQPQGPRPVPWPLL